jgi:hypothetical protein
MSAARTRTAGVGLALLCVLAGAVAAVVEPATAAPPLPPPHCGGVSATVPKGWHSRLREGHGLFTLTLATSPLVSDDGDESELSARLMKRVDVLLLVVAYGSGDVDKGAFRKSVILPLRVERMPILTRFEGMPDGHRMARVLFFARGAAYDVRVQFGGPVTRAARARADAALRGLRFAPAGPTPC